MKRVPLFIVIPLIPSVVGLAWWLGVKDLDFLSEPSVSEIETAKTQATLELAKPSDLFAIDSSEEDKSDPKKLDQSKPVAPVETPRIEEGALGDEVSLDEWSLLEGFPAASYIDLASRLEAAGQLNWSRVAWERVLDHVPASSEEKTIAIKAIQRIRKSVAEPGPTNEEAPKISLSISTPNDRVQITERAADQAIDILEKATDGLIRFEASVQGADTSQLSVILGNEESKPIETLAPSLQDEILQTIIKCCFSSAFVQLNEMPGVQDIQSIESDSSVEDALASHITRRYWLKLAEFVAENP